MNLFSDLLRCAASFLCCSACLCNVGQAPKGGPELRAQAFSQDLTLCLSLLWRPRGLTGKVVLRWVEMRFHKITKVGKDVQDSYALRGKRCSDTRHSQMCRVNLILLIFIKCGHLAFMATFVICSLHMLVLFVSELLFFLVMYLCFLVLIRMENTNYYPSSFL